MLFCFGALADEASKKQKVDRLIDALGLRQTFAQAAEQQKEMAKKAVGPLMKQLTDEMLASVPEVKERFTKALETYTENVCAKMSPDELATTYGTLFGAHFSEAELDQLLQYYGSELGKKEVLASQQTNAEYVRLVQKESQERMTKALTQLKSEIMTIVAETRARRDAEDAKQQQ